MVKRNLMVVMLALFLSGCSYIPFFSKGKEEASASSAPSVYANKVVLNKRDALKAAQDFMVKEGLDQEFVSRKVTKIKKIATQEKSPRWVWEVYFESKEDANLKFWKTSPLMVQVDAETGQVLNWGR